MISVSNSSSDSWWLCPSYLYLCTALFLRVARVASSLQVKRHVWLQGLRHCQYYDCRAGFLSSLLTSIGGKAGKEYLFPLCGWGNWGSQIHTYLHILVRMKTILWCNNPLTPLSSWQSLQSPCPHLGNMQGAFSRQAQAGDERRQKKKQKRCMKSHGLWARNSPLVAWVLWLKSWPSATDNLV